MGGGGSELEVEGRRDPTHSSPSSLSCSRPEGALDAERGEEGEVRFADMEPLWGGGHGINQFSQPATASPQHTHAHAHTCTRSGPHIVTSFCLSLSSASEAKFYNELCIVTIADFPLPTHFSIHSSRHVRKKLNYQYGLETYQRTRGF